MAVELPSAFWQKKNGKNKVTREVISNPHGPAPAGPYSPAIKTGNLVYVSGQTGFDPVTKELGSIEEQTKQVLANLETVLSSAGLSLADVVKTNIYLIDIADFAAMNGVYGEIMGDAPPARTTVAVAALPGGASIEIEVIANAG